MSKLTAGILLLALAVIGVVGTAWLACFIPDRYATACFIQGVAFIFVGGVGGFIIAVENYEQP